MILKMFLLLLKFVAIIVLSLPASNSQSLTYCVEPDESCAHNTRPICKEAGAYLGNKNVTVSGKTCQKWNLQTPHRHTWGTEFGDANFCRNPDGTEAPWCYTTDPSTRWELCFQSCAEPTVPPQNTESEGGCKCSAVTTYSARDQEDEIKSPNYPREYCNDLRCRWVIKPGLPGTGVRLHFEAFETESSADYLEIIFVNQIMEQRLARLSGSVETASLPRYTIGSDGGLELFLKTDGSVTRTGFLATFTRYNISEDSCGCPNFVHRATDTEQTISSPNYPKNYCHNLQCYYLIQAQHPYSVQITFEEFDVENRYDSLSIYDGNTTVDSALIEKLTGSLSERKTVVSHKNDMMMVFRSDGDTGHRGFTATFKQVEGPCLCKDLIHSGLSGSFHSPGYPDAYCSNINCTYGISVPEHGLLQITFQQFKLASSDRVVVPSRLGGYSLPLVKWKGSRSTATQSTRFTFDDHGGNFRLETLSSTMQKGGINATYRLVSRPSGCSCPSPNPHNISAPEGNLSLGACGPLDCFYILNHPSGASIISLWVDKVEIHPRTDWLKIYKGTFHLLGYPSVSRTYSGSSRNNSEVSISNTQQPIMIHFHTQDSFTATDSGFRLRYKWHIQECGCGPRNLVAEDNPKNLTSPGFPVPYCNGLSCKYKIRAEDGYQVSVKLVELRTEGGDTDSVGIYDGESAGSRGNRLALLKGRLEDNAIHEFRSNSSIMQVWFTTDGSVVYKGFNLTYQRVPIVHQPSVVGSAESTTTTPSPPTGGGGVVGVVKCEGSVGEAVEKMVSSLNTSPQQTGWAFSTGFLLGLLLAFAVVVVVGLVVKFRLCKKAGCNATVGYKRYPSNTYIENQAYVPNEIRISET